MQRIARMFRVREQNTERCGCAGRSHVWPHAASVLSHVHVWPYRRSVPDIAYQGVGGQGESGSHLRGSPRI
eukprot:3228099-Rhodomonas_salina.5